METQVVGNEKKKPPKLKEVSGRVGTPTYALYRYVIWDRVGFEVLEQGIIFAPVATSWCDP